MGVGREVVEGYRLQFFFLHLGYGLLRGAESLPLPSANLHKDKSIAFMGYNIHLPFTAAVIYLPERIAPSGEELLGYLLP